MGSRNVVALLAVLGLLGAACGSGSDSGPSGEAVDDPLPNELVTPTTPFSTTEPERDSVFSCLVGEAIPAAARPWVDAIGIVTLDDRPVVAGEVDRGGEFDQTVEGDERVLRLNSLPEPPTGDYPVPVDSAAYEYASTLPAPSATDLELRLPAEPAAAGSPTCVPLGPIGFAVTGGFLFGPLAPEGIDIAAVGVFDGCGGATTPLGDYHYVYWSPCFEQGSGDEHSPLAGYLLDGSGIYGPRGQDGGILTNADLDECHGHTHEITWDGESLELYHHHFTYEFPYTVGCFRGEPVDVFGEIQGGPQAPPDGTPPPDGPPPDGPPPSG